MPIEAALCGAVMLTARMQRRRRGDAGLPSAGRQPATPPQRPVSDAVRRVLSNFSAEQAAMAPMRRLWSATKASTIDGHGGGLVCERDAAGDFFSEPPSTFLLEIA